MMMDSIHIPLIVALGAFAASSYSCIAVLVLYYAIARCIWYCLVQLCQLLCHLLNKPREREPYGTVPVTNTDAGAGSTGNAPSTSRSETGNRLMSDTELGQLLASEPQNRVANWTNNLCNHGNAMFHLDAPPDYDSVVFGQQNSNFGRAAGLSNVQEPSSQNEHFEMEQFEFITPPPSYSRTLSNADISIELCRSADRFVIYNVFERDCLSRLAFEKLRDLEIRDRDLVRTITPVRTRLASRSRLACEKLRDRDLVRTLPQ